MAVIILHVVYLCFFETDTGKQGKITYPIFFEYPIISVSETYAIIRILHFIETEVTVEVISYISRKFCVVKVNGVLRI